MSQTILFAEPKGSSNTFSRFMDIPLLGPVYLATLAARAGYHAEVLNENILGRSLDDNELAEADQFCVSCLTSTVERGVALAERYRAVRAARGLPARTHIGGIHASMLPQDVAPYFDHVAVGEGEDLVLDLLGGKVSEPIVYGNRLKNLDETPIPDFSLVRGWKDNVIWPVMTSRGCPFDCNFCSVTEMFGRGYRVQSPERVLEEIMRYRKGRVFFVDDHFAANVKRSERILDLMTERGFRLPWTTQVRADITRHPALVRRMRERGCDWVYVGFESVNPESLLDMQKGQTVEDIRHSVKVFHESSMRVHGMFMFGSDPDTPNVFKTTADFARRCRIDTAQFNILTPLPGTRLFKRIEAENRLLHRTWRYYDGLHVVFTPKHMSPQQLQQGMIACFDDFYSYGTAFADAFITGAQTVHAAVKRLAALPANRPSFTGTVLKFLGRGIVRDWVRENTDYIRALPNA